MGLGSMKRWVVAVLALGVTGLAAAQSEGKLSDSERAKRDAEKVFSFMKFSTVRPVGEKPASKPTPTAAKPAAPARTSVAAGGGSASSVQAAAPATPTPTPTVTTASAEPTPSASRGLVPAAPQPAPATAQPAPVNTLPPADSPVPAQAEPEPEPEPDEVPLKLVSYVAPEMSRQVVDAIGLRDQVVPVRFTVEANGVVSKAEARPGANRKLGVAAVKAVEQWRFAPLPERRQVDVELMFKSVAE